MLAGTVRAVLPSALVTAKRVQSGRGLIPLNCACRDQQGPDDGPLKLLLNCPARLDRGRGAIGRGGNWGKRAGTSRKTRGVQMRLPGRGEGEKGRQETSRGDRKRKKTRFAHPSPFPFLSLKSTNPSSLSNHWVVREAIFESRPREALDTLRESSHTIGAQERPS